MAQFRDKNQLLNEFNQLKDVEQQACDFYLKISNDATIKNKDIKNTFNKIAADESRHVKLVEKIIMIINNNLSEKL